MTLPNYLVGDTASGLANGALRGVVILAALIAVFAVIRLLRSNKKLTKTNETLATTVALLDARNERLGEANARLRHSLDLAPRPRLPRPEPPAPPTVAFQAPAPTQQIPQVDRFGSAT